MEKRYEYLEKLRAAEVASDEAGNLGIGMGNQQSQKACDSDPMAACRQSAKGMLEERIYRLRRQANRLESLLNTLPGVLPKEADEALWDLLLNS